MKNKSIVEQINRTIEDIWITLEKKEVKSILVCKLPRVHQILC